jgi:2-polyprenyl-3-methyl-5-hydroxy-6-metoxy-1,4-benzoquinol methylase
VTEPATTLLSIDRPAEGERPAVGRDVVVEGWAWSPSGPPHVSVTVGDRLADVRRGPWRSDVSAALGVGEMRGFVAVGQATGPPGPIEIVVTAEGADGVKVERRRTVEIAGGLTPLAGRPRPFAGFAERFDPGVDAGGMTHAEHVARYRWAAQVAEGRDVLDAGCGVGFGAHVLHAAGARRVAGVDAFAGAVVEAREQAQPGLEFIVGDVRELPFGEHEFDLVTCFEVIEHVAEQERLLDELARVLRPGGLLAISTPIPGAIALRNPHHVAELDPHEFERLLRERFANVALRWQNSAIASIVEGGPSGSGLAPQSQPLGWATGPVEPLYAIALAGDGELPQTEPVGALAAGYDIGALITEWYETADELARSRAEVTAERARAVRAEGALAAADGRRTAVERELAEALEHLRRLESSRSWALTAPLRAAARARRRRTGTARR